MVGILSPQLTSIYQCDIIEFSIGKRHAPCVIDHPIAPAENVVDTKDFTRDSPSPNRNIYVDEAYLPFLKHLHTLSH